MYPNRSKIHSLHCTVLALVLVFALSSCGYFQKINPFGAGEEEDKSSPTPIIDSLATEHEGETPLSSEEQGTEELSPPESSPEKSPPPKQSSNLSSIEIVWQVPGESVERYHLAYGTDRNSLDQELTIPVSELNKIDDPIHGPVFRYTLSGIEVGTPIFFTIQAENQYGLSPKSPVQELK